MLWAVHLPDNVLRNSGQLAGFGLAALLLVPACRKLRDDEIPRIALLTAGFFVASLIHVRVGPTSVHLLLNGLLGVVLGVRAPLAIVVGLVLQAFLFQHGGFYALGANACVMSIPALVASAAFRLLHRLDWNRPVLRFVVTATSSAAWLASLAFSVAILSQGPARGWSSFDVGAGFAFVMRPATLGAIFLLSAIGARLETRLETAPEFPLGLALGGLSVLATIALNAWAVIEGGEDAWQPPAYLALAVHLPLAALEGVIVGFALGFLAKAKPELLGIAAKHEERGAAASAPLGEHQETTAATPSSGR